MPDAKATHQKGVSTAGKPLTTEWYKHRGMIRFYQKFFRRTYPATLFNLAVIGIWIRFAVVAIGITLFERRRD